MMKFMCTGCGAVRFSAADTGEPCSCGGKVVRSDMDVYDLLGLVRPEDC